MNQHNAQLIHLIPFALDVSISLEFHIVYLKCQFAICTIETKSNIGLALNCTKFKLLVFSLFEFTTTSHIQRWGEKSKSKKHSKDVKI